MAQKKITDLPEIDALADADLIEVVDDVAGTATSKKSTWTKIKSFLKSYFDEIYAGGLVLTTVNAANHTLSADEVAGAVNILHVTYTDTGAVAITIPTAVITSGEWTLFVKDADFNANTNNITICCNYIW